MSSSSISLTIPLVDAAQSRKTGAKATNLSKLITARFAVPRGFVISVDAYRSHLWASGARAAATSADDSQARQAIRTVILSADVPRDVWMAVAEAYQRLSWQLGESEPAVTVCPSPLDEALPDTGSVGECDVRLEVSGPEALKEAIKHVWASQWGEEALGAKEPAAAVIVFQALRGKWTGTARTADPATGNPHCVSISCVSPSGVSEYKVDLRDMSVDPASDDPGNDTLKRLAEKAVLIENTIGSPVEMEWVYEGDRFWILDAHPIAPLPRHFSPKQPLGSDGVPLRRITSRPLSYFSRDHLRTARPECTLVNGRAYLTDTGDDCRPSTIDRRLISESLKELESWEKEVGPGFMRRAAEIVRGDLSGMDHARLTEKMSGLSEVWLRADEWMRRSSIMCATWTGELRETVVGLTDDPGISYRLLGGLPGPVFMRDARLQELGERFGIAERSGKLQDQAWWKNFRAEVVEFVQEYGYSFKDMGEMLDPAAWKSWVEDQDDVFRMIGAISKRGVRPTIVTLHCAAETEALKAEAEVAQQMKANARANFAKLLRLTRGWLAARNDCEQALALTCTALRLTLMEIGRRLSGAEVITQAEDVFHLTLNEVLSISPQSTDEDRSAVATNIADRKHHIWLENRLAVPENAEAFADSLNATQIAPGIATGRARVARSMADAGEIDAGDILIVDSLTQAWTPFLAVAGGIVSEQEPEGCAAISAFVRDYGVPIVAGCRGILAAIADGQRITVDANDGLVE